mmetsp:Transcript_33795/g.61297  ORF Transcript_33795/g.61297 Transcript_33795/m.61297 type:complete len:255 (+) Transcript_33795:258-1022(+)
MKKPIGIDRPNVKTAGTRPQTAPAAPPATKPAQPPPAPRATEPVTADAAVTCAVGFDATSTACDPTSAAVCLTCLRNLFARILVLSSAWLYALTTVGFSALSCNCLGLTSGTSPAGAPPAPVKCRCTSTSTSKLQVTAQEKIPVSTTKARQQKAGRFWTTLYGHTDVNRSCNFVRIARKGGAMQIFALLSFANAWSANSRPSLKGARISSWSDSARPNKIQGPQNKDDQMWTAQCLLGTSNGLHDAGETVTSAP